MSLALRQTMRAREASFQGTKRRAAPPTAAEGLLLVWAALLGVQVSQDLVARFNIAVSDLVLATLLVVVVTDARLRAKAIALPVELSVFFATMVAALLVGMIVDASTLGYVPTDGWLNKGVGLVVLAATVACVRAVADTREAIGNLLGAFLLGAVGSAAIGIALWLGSSLLGQEARFAGFLLNANAAGLYYMLGMLLLFAEFGRTRFRFPATARIVSAILLGVTILLTFSVGALLGGLAGLGVLALGSPRRMRWPVTLALLAVLAFSLPAIGASLRPLSVEGDVFEQAAASRTNVAEPSILDAPLLLLGGVYSPDVIAAKGSSTFERLALDAIGIDLWTSDFGSAVFGIGLSAFPIKSGAFGGAIIHNTYLALAVDLGLAGILAQMVLLWYVLALALGLLRYADRSGAISLIAAFVLFLVWWAANEGLYQRSFWLLVASASVLVDVSRRAQGSVKHVRPIAVSTNTLLRLKAPRYD